MLSSRRSSAALVGELTRNVAAVLALLAGIAIGATAAAALIVGVVAYTQIPPSFTLPENNTILVAPSGVGAPVAEQSGATTVINGIANADGALTVGVGGGAVTINAPRLLAAESDIDALESDVAALQAQLPVTLAAAGGEVSAVVGGTGPGLSIATFRGVNGTTLTRVGDVLEIGGGGGGGNGTLTGVESAGAGASFVALDGPTVALIRSALSSDGLVVINATGDHVDFTLPVLQGVLLDVAALAAQANATAAQVVVLDGRANQTDADVGALAAALGVAQGAIVLLDGRQNATEVAVATLGANVTSIEGRLAVVEGEVPVTVASAPGGAGLVVVGAGPDLELVNLMGGGLIEVSRVGATVFINVNVSALNGTVNVTTGIEALTTNSTTPGAVSPIEFGGKPVAILSGFANTDAALTVTKANGTVVINSPRLGVLAGQWVDNAGGSDDTGTGTQAAPFATIARATQDCHEGQVVTVLLANSAAPYTLVLPTSSGGAARCGVNLIAPSQLATTPYGGWSRVVASGTRDALESVYAIDAATASPRLGYKANATLALTQPEARCLALDGATLVARYHPPLGTLYTFGANAAAGMTLRAPNVVVNSGALRMVYPMRLAGVDAHFSGALTSTAPLTMTSARLSLSGAAAFTESSWIDMYGSCLISDVQNVVINSATMSMTNSAVYRSTAVNVWGASLLEGSDALFVNDGATAGSATALALYSGSLTLTRALVLGGLNTRNTVYLLNTAILVDGTTLINQTTSSFGTALTAYGSVDVYESSAVLDFGNRTGGVQMVTSNGVMRIFSSAFLMRGTSGASLPDTYFFYGRISGAVMLTDVAVEARGITILTVVNLLRGGSLTLGSPVCARNEPGTLLLANGASGRIVTVSNAAAPVYVPAPPASFLNATCLVGWGGPPTYGLMSATTGNNVFFRTEYAQPATKAQVAAATSAYIYGMGTGAGAAGSYTFVPPTAGEPATDVLYADGTWATKTFSGAADGMVPASGAADAGDVLTPAGWAPQGNALADYDVEAAFSSASGATFLSDQPWFGRIGVADTPNGQVLMLKASFVFTAAGAGTFALEMPFNVSVVTSFLNGIEVRVDGSGDLVVPVDTTGYQCASNRLVVTYDSRFISNRAMLCSIDVEAPLNGTVFPTPPFDGCNLTMTTELPFAISRYGMVPPPPTTTDDALRLTAAGAWKVGGGTYSYFTAGVYELTLEESGPYYLSACGAGGGGGAGASGFCAGPPNTFGYFGGGGGAGGQCLEFPVMLEANTTYTITVGTGGVPAAAGTTTTMTSSGISWAFGGGAGAIDYNGTPGFYGGGGGINGTTCLCSAAGTGGSSYIGYYSAAAGSCSGGGWGGGSLSANGGAWGACGGNGCGGGGGGGGRFGGRGASNLAAATNGILGGGGGGGHFVLGGPGSGGDGYLILAPL